MSPAAVAAAALVALVVLLLARPRARLPGPGWRWTARTVVGAAAVVGVPAVAVGGHLVLLVGVAAAVVVAGARLAAVRRRAGEAAAAAAGVAEFCDTVSAELTAGTPAHRALLAGAEDVPALAAAAAAAGLGADVPTALRALAEQPGRQDLRVVAAAWQVSSRSGGGLAEPLERAAATLRDRRRTAHAVRAELAPARATARLMAVLPVVFLVAGSGLGGHPLAFLATTGPGTVCLVVGLLLSYAGLAWVERIAASVEEGPP